MRFMNLVSFFAIIICFLNPCPSDAVQCNADLEQTFSYSSSSDSVSSGTVLTWEHGWKIVLTGYDGTMLNPVITFQPDRTFTEVWPDDPEVMTYNDATNTYTWKDDPLWDSYSPVPNQMYITLSEDEVEESIPFSIERTISPQVIDQDSVVQTVTINFSLNQSVDPDMDNISIFIYFPYEHELLEGTLVSQNELTGWNIPYSNESCITWQTNDVQNLELNKTYTFVAEIKIQKLSGSTGNPTYIPMVSLLYSIGKIFPYINNQQSVTLSHPQGPTATFQVDNTNASWQTFVTEQSYNVLLTSRFNDGDSTPGNCSDACVQVGDDLTIPLDCVSYMGQNYGLTLAFNASSSTWTLQPGSIGTCDNACIQAGNDLSIPLGCASYKGTDYSLTLDFDSAAGGWAIQPGSISVLP